MDLEAALGLLLMAAASGWLLYWVFQAIVRQPSQTLAEFGKAPLLFICAWLGVIGVLMFCVGIVSMGRLTFEIPTPWGYVKSQWAGGLLALLSIPALLLPRRGK
jgi:hypothetical protein